ncbi:MAG: MBL fold metallo-hydrolase [Acidobacteriota bacterium]
MAEGTPSRSPASSGPEVTTPRADSPKATRPEVERFDSGDGRKVYRLPMEVFSGFWGNAYLVTGGARPILVDCGSGQPASNRNLSEAFEVIGQRYGETVRLADVGEVVLTHGHIDHFGGLGYVREQSNARVSIHVLDRGVVGSYRERVAMAVRHLELFFRSAGVSEDKLGGFMASYGKTKALFSQGDIDEAFEEGPILDGQLEAIHVPGHCPGQVCLRAGVLLMTADHLLERISPHLSPESITLSTGLWHYMRSLERVEQLDGVRLGLGGHGNAIDDLKRRVAETRASHAERLSRVLDLCREPKPIVELSRSLFGHQASYHVLLALLETGALVEYLYQRGELTVANAADVERGGGPAVILYRRA